METFATHTTSHTILARILLYWRLVFSLVVCYISPCLCRVPLFLSLGQSSRCRTTTITKRISIMDAYGVNRTSHTVRLQLHKHMCVCPKVKPERVIKINSIFIYCLMCLCVRVCEQLGIELTPNACVCVAIVRTKGKKQRTQIKVAIVR